MWFKDKIEIGRYIDTNGAYSDGADYTVRLDANDSALWCSTSIAQGSDRQLKENIEYLDDEPAFLTTEDSSSTPFKDFIKDFKFATYNYIGNEGKCFGFVAQDIDDIDASIVKDIVMNNHIKTYHLKEEVKEMENIEAEAQELGIELEVGMTTPNTRAGLILEDLTPEADNLLHPERTDGIDTYAMVSVLWKFCQEQQKEIEMLKEKLGL